MRSKRKATNIPDRWQPYAQLTAAAAVACGGERSLHTSLLGGGRSHSIVERNLLSQFKGEEANQQQATDDRAEPSLALSLRVGSEEEPQSQNRMRFLYTPTRHRQRPSLLPRGSSVPPRPQTSYAPGPSPAGPAGLAPPQLGLGSNSLPLPLGPTPPEPRCGACNLGYSRLAADLQKRVGEELDRRVGMLRQELTAEVRKEVLRLHAAAAGVPLPAAAAFSAAGLPQPQPCGGGGAWRRCPACAARPGTVALKPYEHLCLCAQCSATSRLCLHCYFSSFSWIGAVEDAARGRGRGR